MATYGKKKKSILPSFSSLRDLNSASGSKKDKAKKRVSTTNYATSSARERDIPDPHSDSIEELASMLLENTNIDQLRSQPGTRLSQIGTAKVISSRSASGYRNSKGLPQLPKLMFNGDDAWAMRTAPVVTAASYSNETDFSAYEDKLQASDSAKATRHTRKDSAPPIPRRSSKRMSARPLHPGPAQPLVEPTRYALQPRAEMANLSLPHPVTPVPAGRPTTNAQEINDKIAAMVAATKALKGDDQSLLQGPYVPVKKRRLKDNVVLTKVRTAITDHLHARTLRKRHDPARDDYLLGNMSANDLQSPEHGASPSPDITSVERRLNEGDNLKNPKVYSLTGHGIIRRKQVAEDGKSLRSLKSVSDDPFAERPSSSRITRTPTSFETRLTEDMSIDQGQEYVPDLPSRAQHLDDLPLPRSKKTRPSVIYDTDFDALFSSSPLAQSTPRIRLEPTFQDGRTTLKNVPADTRSLFDPESSGSRYSDMDVDTSLVATNNESHEMDVKQKKLQTKDIAYVVKPNGGKRMKKHPSPSKAELESLENAMTDFPDEQMSRSQTYTNLSNFSAMDYESTSAVGALASKDANTKLPIPKTREKRRGFEKYLKPSLTRSAGTMPDLSRSKIPRYSDGSLGKIRLEARPERQFVTKGARDDINGGDLMDIDELQWEQTALMGRR